MESTAVSPSFSSASLQDVKRLFPIVVRRAWLSLLLIHLGREVSSQVVNYAGIAFQRQGREDLSLLLSVVGITFVFEILWSAIWSFAAISAIRFAIKDEPIAFARIAKDFNQLLVEGIRALAAIIFRLPLLIIPAAIEILRVLFVPHVVLLDPLYRSGQVDALTRSRQLVRAAWLPLLTSTSLCLAIGAFTSLLIQGDAGEAWVWQRPVAFAVDAALTLVINLIYEIFLVALFMRLSTTLRRDNS